MIENFVMRLFGLGKAIDALDGETSKSYLGGAGLILAGLGSIAAGAAGVVGELVAAHGGPAYLALLKNLPHDASAGLVLGGYASIKAGIAAIGLRHAMAKAAAAAPAAAPVAAPAPSAPATQG